MSKIRFFYGSPGFGKTTNAIRLAHKLKRDYLFIYSPIQEEDFHDVLESRNGDCLKLTVKPLKLDHEFFNSNYFKDVKFIIVDEIQNRSIDEIKLLINEIDKQDKIGIFFGTLYDCRGHFLKSSFTLLEEGIISIPIKRKCLKCDDLAITSLYYNEKKNEIYTTITEKDMDDPNCRLIQVCRSCLKKCLENLQAF